MSDISLALENYGVERFLDELGAKHIHRMGGQVRSCCPVHKGNNDSAFCYFDGRFRCFSGCNKTYSIIGLVMAVKGLPYEKAKEYLERLFDRSFQDVEPATIDEDSIDNRLWLKKIKCYKPTQMEYKPFDLSDKLKYKPGIGNLLEDEHFGPETAKRFDLRLCFRGYMTDRIIIPIHSPGGEIIGAAGRSIYTARECSIKGISKYLFTRGLKKGYTLYNYHVAKEQTDKWTFVVEGYKSVWRLAQWGYFNSVALMGARPTREQEILLLRLNTGLVLCGDKDEAGKRMNDTTYGRLRNYVPIKTFSMDKTSAIEKDSIAELSRKEFETWVKETL